MQVLTNETKLQIDLTMKRGLLAHEATILASAKEERMGREYRSWSSQNQGKRRQGLKRRGPLMITNLPGRRANHKHTSTKERICTDRVAKQVYEEHHFL
jgi:hypothetical protein